MYYFENTDNKEILKSDFMENAFFTTRSSCIKSKDPNIENIISKNKETLIKYLGVEKLVSPSQTHSANIAVVQYDKETYPETDALILTDKRIGIFLNFADCTPIIIYDNKRNIGAIAHGGWRGTAANISGKTVQFMIHNFNCSTHDMTALIGPCISKCCFEVDEDVYKNLYSSIEIRENNSVNGKFFADLKEINKIQLEREGITRIDICPYCTVCNNNKFFSYRKENGTTNRHSAVLKLKDILQ